MIGRWLFARINHVWRLLCTGLAFIFFGVGALILSTIVFPLIYLFVSSPEKIKLYFRWAIRWSFKLFIGFLHHSRVFTISVKGQEILNSDKGLIMVANHPCLIDVTALMAIVPNVTCIVKQELWDNFFIKGVVKGAGYISNADSDNILDLCKEALGRGENIIIFPEGTRTIPDRPMLVNRGAAQLALRSGANIRPIEITMEPSTLTKGEPWYSVPDRRGDFRLEVKELIEPSNLLSGNMRLSVAARRLTEQIYQSIDSKKLP